MLALLKSQPRNRQLFAFQLRGPILPKRLANSRGPPPRRSDSNQPGISLSLIQQRETSNGNAPLNHRERTKRLSPPPRRRARLPRSQLQSRRPHPGGEFTPAQGRGHL